MSIVNELRGLIEARGGSAVGVMTISQACAKLEALELANNPLSALTIDTTIGAATDLLGKVVADLQKDVVIGKDKITGTLHYIDDYTDFSGLAEEQIGHYLAIHASVPEVTGYTISIKLSTKAGEKDLDSDGILILRVTESHKDMDAVLTFTAKKTGYANYSKSFALKDLVLEPQSSS